MHCLFSFFKSFFIGKAERETQRSSICCSTPHMPAVARGWVRPKSGVWNFIGVSHVAGRAASAGAILCCLPRCTSARSRVGRTSVRCSDVGGGCPTKQLMLLNHHTHPTLFFLATGKEDNQEVEQGVSWHCCAFHPRRNWISPLTWLGSTLTKGGTLYHGEGVGLECKLCPLQL